jgi:hypothetical protein
MNNTEFDGRETITEDKDSIEGAESMEMPKYTCHKEVWALQIKEIIYAVDQAQGTNQETDGSAMITPVEEGYAPFRVDHTYLKKHRPEVGGYFILYKGGYKSFSPKQPFEEGYTKQKIIRNICYR